MKSMSLVEYIPGRDGEQGELVEVARHFQASFATAVSHIEGDTYLESDSDGNLIVLRRNIAGVTLEDRQRLEVTSEMNLGEMVNRIRKIDVETSPNATVVPRAFLCTVSLPRVLVVPDRLRDLTLSRPRVQSTFSGPSLKALKTCLCVFNLGWLT
jgi:hypothetical protein